MIRRGRKRDMFSLAGWLFSDLFIVLAIIFVASTAMRTPNPKDNVLPSTPTVSKPPSLNPVPVTLQVTMNANRLLAHDPAVTTQVETQVRAQLRQKKATQFIAGMVLTFGGGTQDDRIAKAINDILLSMGKREHLVFNERTVFENYIDLQMPLGIVAIKIFAFAHQY